jgi:chromosome segregation ATPase
MALQGIVQAIQGAVVTLATDYATLTPMEGCMAEVLPFYNANQLQKIDRLEREFDDAKKLVNKLLDSLNEAQTLADIWCNAHTEAEEEVQMLLDDVAHGHQRVKFVQRENAHLKRKIDTLEAELAAQKKKYELAMTWWRYEGAD